MQTNTTHMQGGHVQCIVILMVSGLQLVSYWSLTDSAAGLQTVSGLSMV